VTVCCENISAYGMTFLCVYIKALFPPQTITTSHSTSAVLTIQHSKHHYLALDSTAFNINPISSHGASHHL
jgi:hypothetical protein